MAVRTTEEKLAKLRATTVEAKLKMKSIKNEMKQKEKKNVRIVYLDTAKLSKNILAAFRLSSWNFA